MKPMWNKHKGVVITGAQIITVITLIIGLLSNYSESSQNKSDIASSSQWMKDAIKSQNKEIIELRIESAIMKAKYENLKERADLNDFVDKTESHRHHRNLNE